MVVTNKRYVSDDLRLMAEWDFDKNTNIVPSQVTIGSSRKVWWLGACGHSWEAIVKERTRGYGCPICAGKRVVEGINDLASNYPLIALQWDYEKNHPFSPNVIAAKSHKQVWWRCEQGHSYKTSVDNRTRGRGCPYCHSKTICAGTNDLKSQNEILAQEYSPKNPMDSNAVFINSHKKVWWICSRCKHEWKATVDSRNRGNGCPYCALEKRKKK